jgi:hypothetical protein
MTGSHCVKKNLSGKLVKLFDFRIQHTVVAIFRIPKQLKLVVVATVLLTQMPLHILLVSDEF